jgi:tetratricopeptide (TPR) repeat protein
MTSTDNLFKKAEEHVGAGRLEAAIGTYKSLLRHNPKDVRAMYRLGVVLLMQGRYADGEERLRACLCLRPGDADILYSLGRACLAQGRNAEAVEVAKRGIQVAPSRPDLHALLGDAYFLGGHPQWAFEVYEKTLELNPRDLRTRVNIALAIARLSSRNDAVAFMRPAYEEAGDRKEIALAFAKSLRIEGAFDEALEVIDRVLESAPGDLDVIACKAGILDRTGDNSGAAAMLLPHLESDAPTSDFVQICGLTALNQNEPLLPIDRVVTLVESFAARRQPNIYERRSLLFTLAELLEIKGEYARAFEACLRANAEITLAYDVAATRDRFAGYREIFSADRLPGLPRASNRSTRPLFIVGMPRSGTSLIEQILDSHPDVAGAGELTDIPFATRRIGGYPRGIADMESGDLDAIAASYFDTLDSVSAETRHVTDKMPINFEHLGFIRQVLPGARIIHCRRHPLDVCLSCLFINFQNENRFANGLESLADYYRHYHALMDFWAENLDLPRFELRYDDLVDDPRATIAAVLEFCDLPWDDACLAFDRNRRRVMTASYAQVRRPINRAGLGRYAKYARELAPLAEALAVEIARYEAGGRAGG